MMKKLLLSAISVSMFAASAQDLEHFVLLNKINTDLEQEILEHNYDKYLNYETNHFYLEGSVNQYKYKDKSISNQYILVGDAVVYENTIFSFNAAYSKKSYEGDKFANSIFAAIYLNTDFDNGFLTNLGLKYVHSSINYKDLESKHNHLALFDFDVAYKLSLRESFYIKPIIGFNKAYSFASNIKSTQDYRLLEHSYTYLKAMLNMGIYTGNNLNIELSAKYLKDLSDTNYTYDANKLDIKRNDRLIYGFISEYNISDSVKVNFAMDFGNKGEIKKDFGTTLGFSIGF